MAASRGKQAPSAAPEGVNGQAPAASLPPPGDPETLYILDISGYVFRAYHALPPLSSSRGEPTHAVLGVTNMLLKLIKEQHPAMLAVAMESRGPGKRKEAFPGYKANRPPAPPDLSQQIERVREICEAYAIPMLSAEGYEADDVIASVVARRRAQGKRTVIVGADKDLLQLVGDDVVMYDTMPNRERLYGPAETTDKMGVPPAQVRDLLALMGDSSDNVPGVPKVGQKTAAQLLADFGNIDGIYEHLDEVKRKAIKQTLTDHRDQAYLSRDLVTLHDDLPLDLHDEDLRFGGADTARLRALFTELEFTRLLGDLAPEPVTEAQYSVVTDLEGLRDACEAARAAGRVCIHPVLITDDPLEADLLGVSLSWKKAEAIYVPLMHRYIGAPDQPRAEAVLELLGPLLTDPELPKVSDHIKRDLLVFQRRGISIESAAFDTMIASYLLDPGRHGHSLAEVARAELNAQLLTRDRLGGKKKESLDVLDVERIAEYAGQQADFALRLTEVLMPRMQHGEFRSLMEDLELPLSHVLADMERTGIRLDVGLLRRMSAEVTEQLATVEARCVELAGHPFNVGSPRQLETILFDELGLRVVKKTKTARSTDSDVLEELSAEHPLPAAILEHRALAKLKSTYLDALPACVSKRTGRVHTRYDQAVARTGRLSSNDPNLQNIPIRTELGRRVRDAFIPEEGWSILSADYSQIELRVLAHLSQDPALCDAFQHHVDVHVRTATALFDVSEAEVTRHQRDQAKTVNYAVIYGQTQFALARNLGIERREAKRYIEAFFERYAGVARFMEEIIEEGRREGYVKTLLGRRRSLPDIRSKNRQLRMAAERIARNTPIQGTAADIMKLAMVHIHRALGEEGLKSRLLLTVHDELVFEAPPEEKDALDVLVRRHMEKAMALSVPLVVDLGWGPHWGAAH